MDKYTWNTNYIKWKNSRTDTRFSWNQPIKIWTLDQQKRINPQPTNVVIIKNAFWSVAKHKWQAES